MADMDVDEEPRGVDLGFLKLGEAGEPVLLRGLLSESKVGGSPVWTDPILTRFPVPDNPELVSQEILCGLCKKSMPLLLQIYTPADEKADYFHRVVYVFCCKNGPCHKDFKKCFRVIRSQIAKENNFYLPDGSPKPGVKIDVKPCIACGLPGPKSCGKCHQAHYCSKDHQVAHWNLGHRELCGKEHSLTGQQKAQFEKLLGQFKFPQHEIETEEEFLDEEEKAEAEEDSDDEQENAEETEVPANQMQIVPANQAASDEPKALDFDEIKKDKEFMKFQSRVSLYRDQILRYYRVDFDDLQKEPLWVSESGRPAPGDVPPCETCGAPRAIEFQIMPQLLHHLHVDDSQAESIDWGTLLVYTCTQSCAKSGRVYFDEFLWRQSFSNIGMSIQKNL